MDSVSSKEDLEKAKLALEIDELSKPLYRRPALYAVLGPTLLATATLSLGFYTGLFDIKNETIRNQTTLLEIRKSDLNKEIASLEFRKKEVDEQLNQSKAEVARVKAESEAEVVRVKGQSRAEIARIESEFETKISSIRTDSEQALALAREEFAKASQNLEDNFQKERAALAAKLHPLESQLSLVNRAIGEKNAELLSLQAKYENAEVTTLLEQFKAEREQSPHSQFSKGLIAALERRPGYVKIFEEYLNREQDALYRANLLHILYKGTRNKEWLSQLYSLLSDAKNKNVDGLWNVIGLARWEGAIEIEVMKFVIQSRANLRPRDIGDVMIMFHLTANDALLIRSQLSEDERGALFLMGRKLALDRNAHPYSRLYGVHACALIVPEAFPVFLAFIYSRAGEPQEMLNSVKEWLLQTKTRSSFDREYRQLNLALHRLNFPRELSVGIGSWLSTGEPKRWADLLMGAKLYDVVR